MPADEWLTAAGSGGDTDAAPGQGATLAPACSAAPIIVIVLAALAVLGLVSAIRIVRE